MTTVEIDDLCKGFLDAFHQVPPYDHEGKRCLVHNLVRDVEHSTVKSVVALTESTFPEGEAAICARWLIDRLADLPK